MTAAFLRDMRLILWFKYHANEFVTCLPETDMTWLPNGVEHFTTGRPADGQVTVRYKRLCAAVHVNIGIHNFGVHVSFILCYGQSHLKGPYFLDGQGYGLRPRWPTFLLGMARQLNCDGIYIWRNFSFIIMFKGSGSTSLLLEIGHLLV